MTLNSNSIETIIKCFHFIKGFQTLHREHSVDIKKLQNIEGLKERRPNHIDISPLSYLLM